MIHNSYLYDLHSLGVWVGGLWEWTMGGGEEVVWWVVGGWMGGWVGGWVGEHKEQCVCGQYQKHLPMSWAEYPLGRAYVSLYRQVKGCYPYPGVVASLTSQHG